MGDFHFQLHSNSRRHPAGGKRYWVCSRRGAGCRAALYTIDQQIVAYKNPQFIESSRGGIMIKIGNYQFSLHSNSRRNPAGVKKYWVCCKIVDGARCRAALYTVDKEIIMYKGYHSH
ncbi:hypothetical protein JYU34_004437 [Plutella xylostella]|uniref:FLYWCH-type domain-containing protein n=1 Tax=Plutella xylostella TaxID=51655 RepID=A0ABQ7QY00_PLUXY|nr:hypothetical protein JYU34_004437 [Plutella xylostella]